MNLCDKLFVNDRGSVHATFTFLAEITMSIQITMKGSGVNFNIIVITNLSIPVTLNIRYS